MDREKFEEFLKNRKPSPHTKKFSNLPCYGCAHSASSVPPPGKPSGERPCCSCVRNPEREEWGEDCTGVEVVMDDHGHAHIFDPFMGTAYNGGPLVYFPMDNYITLDAMDQSRFLDKHPEYAKAVSFNKAGNLEIID